MKKVCLNYEYCDYFYYYKEEEDIDFQNPYQTCPNCNCLTVLVRDDYDISTIADNILEFKINDDFNE